MKLTLRKSRAKQVASWISIVFAPPAVSTAAVLLLPVDSARNRMQYLTIAILLPVVWVLALRYSGRVRGLDLAERKERFLPMWGTVTCAVIGWWFLHRAGEPMPLTLFSEGYLCAAVLLLLATVADKVSFHTAAIVGIGYLLMQSEILSPLAYAGLVLAVGWSRVELQKHTVLQVLVGGALGFISYGPLL